MARSIDEQFVEKQDGRHFMQQVREQQAVLAQDVSRKLFTKYCSTELEVLKAQPKEERLFRKELLKQEFQGDVYNAVMGYSDWFAADLIVKYENTNTFEPRILPSDKEISYSRIQEEYGVSLGLVYLVSREMHKQGSIPMIGTVQGAYILPDEEILLKWRDLFDWSDD